MQKRSSRRLVVLLALAGLTLVAAVSCRTASSVLAPRAWHAPSGRVALVVSRVENQAQYYFVASPHVAIDVSFDPAVVDLRRVRSYGLWLMVPGDGAAPGDGSTPAALAGLALDSGGTGRWTKFEDVVPADLPSAIELDREGVWGVRASVRYDDGKESFVPAARDLPHLFICLDTTPPRLEFSPEQRRSVPLVQPTVDLVWNAEEMRFGNSPVVVEWSRDGGSTWNALAKVPARTGTTTYRWHLPRTLAGRVEVRLRARDLTGHEGSAVLDLVRGAAPADREPASGEGATGVRVAGAGAPVSASLAESDPYGAASPARYETQRDSHRQALGESDAGGPAPGFDRAKEPAEIPADSAPVSADAGVARVPDRLEGDAADADSAPALVRLEPLPARCLRGGSVVELHWTSIMPAANLPLPVSLEVALDGEPGWTARAEAKLGDGTMEWEIPAVPAARCRIRLVLGGVEPPVSVEAAEDYGIDTLPPEIHFARLAQSAGLVRSPEEPARVGGPFRLTLPAADSGCAETTEVRCFVRRGGEGFWEELGQGGAVVERGIVTLDFHSRPEGPNEVFLVARDAVGNEGSAPGPESKAQGIVYLDWSAPRLSARTPVLPWVAGFRASVHVDFDPSDCVPPLVLQARLSGGEWRELRRFASLAAAREEIDFVVPLEDHPLELRVLVRDATGNLGETVLGPRPIEPPLRLLGFESTRRLPSFSSEAVTWSLHPVAREREDELRVTIVHLRAAGGAWETLAENLPATSPFHWIVPAADSAEHRIAVRLFAHGEMVGEEVSATFTIAALEVSGPASVPPGVSTATAASAPELLAEAQRNARVFEDFAGSLGKSEELPDSARQAAEKAVAGYREVLGADPSSFDATYGIARLLQRMSSGAHDAEVLDLLRRSARLRPDHVSALNDFAVALIRAEKFAEAEGVLVAALERQASPLLRFNLGLVLLLQDQPLRARAELEAALLGSGEVPEGDAYFYIAYTYIQEKRLPEARSILAEKGTLMSEELRADLVKRL